MSVVGIDINQFAPAHAREGRSDLLRTREVQGTETITPEGSAIQMTYIKDPPYFGEPKLARLMSNPLGCAFAAVLGNVIFSPPCSMTNLLSAS